MNHIRNEAYQFINGFLSSETTIEKLYQKLEDWELEEEKLSLINISKRSDAEIIRYHYLEYLLEYAEEFIKNICRHEK